MQAPIIAIDGPAGAGKTSAARALAERLGFLLLDTGAIYRAVALVAREAGVPWTDEAGLGQIACGLEIAFEPAPTGQRVLVAGRDRTADIRTPEISEGASQVSARPAVRDALLELQRRLGRAARVGLVVEGRDVGSVVFPAATLKVFLTASPEARAERRHQELLGRGLPSDLPATLHEIRKRDERDSTREAAPLRVADRAVVLDTSGMPFATVVAALEALYHKESGSADRG